MLSCQGVTERAKTPPNHLVAWQRLLLTAGWLIAFASSSAPQSPARYVLLLNSFEREPFIMFAGLLRTDLSRQSPDPLNLFEVSIQPAPFAPTPQEEPIVNYLRSTLAGRRLDLVVSLGGPAAVFAQKYQQELFPSTPILHAALDVRRLGNQPLSLNETAVTAQLEPTRWVEHILAVRPETTNLFVVLGTSDFEKFWRVQLAQEFARFADRLQLNWLDDLSVAEMLKTRVGLTAPFRNPFRHAVGGCGGRPAVGTGNAGPDP